MELSLSCCHLKWRKYSGEYNWLNLWYIRCDSAWLKTVCEQYLTRLKPVQNDWSISLSSKIQLMCSFVTAIFLNACESWTLTVQLLRRIQAMEIRFYCKILCISYKDHVTNEEVRAKIQQAIRPHKDHLTIIKRGKLQWYGHVSRSSGLAKTIFQGTVKGQRWQDRQRKRWENTIGE